MKKHQILVPAEYGEHALSGASQIPVALGVNDDHGLTPGNGLGDQEIKRPGLSGPGGPDNQGMSLGFTQGLNEGVVLLGQLMNPGGSTKALYTALRQNFVRPLGMLRPPVETIAEIAVVPVRHAEVV